MATKLDSTTAMSRRLKPTDNAKSGFDMSYKSHIGRLAIGRLYPTTYQHLMPGDKFSGSNASQLYFNALSTPVMSPLHVSQHNFLVTLRSIDTQFEDMFAPSERNSMSANFTCPTFSISEVIHHLLYDFVSKFPINLDTNHHFGNYTGAHTYETIASALASLGGAYNLQNAYRGDLLVDIAKQIAPDLDAAFTNSGTSASAVAARDAAYTQALMKYMDAWFGEGSLADLFGYPIADHNFIQNQLIKGVLATTRSAAIAFTNILSQQLIDTYIPNARVVNEYPFRALFAIWTEYYRKPDFEKRSSNFPDYHKFGGTALLSNRTGYYLLLTPCRCWGDDIFTTAAPDSLFRYVYAPVIASDTPFTSYSSPSSPSLGGSVPSHDFNGQLLSSAELSYFDVQSQSYISIQCPLPDGAAKMLASYNSANEEVSDYYFDLKTLQKMSLFQRYVKRVSLGDEYRDYMQNVYGVTLEDYRINRPMFLSASLDAVDPNQKMATAGTTPTGTMQESGNFTQRVVAPVASQNASDGFSMFCTEFAIYIGLTSAIPEPQYDFECPQNYQQKIQDFPNPVLAPQQEEIMTNIEMARNLNKSFARPFGNVPYAHAYRGRCNEVHGDYLSDRFDYTFCRFFECLTQDGVPVLNAGFLHCRPNLPMFVNSILLDGQYYGTFVHNFYVERQLPSATELI